MIKVIGFKKALSLILLAFLLVVLAVYWLYALTPDIKKKQRQLAINSSEVSQMADNIDALIKGVDQFEQQKTVFEKIKKLGFFDPQNRPETRQRLSAMQKESRLLSAKFSISSAKTEKSEKATEAGYKILNTEIVLTLGAIEDADIYKFVYLMNYGFPGQITINQLNMTRDVEVTQPILRQIGVGESKPLVIAVLSVNWRTMVPDSSLAITIDGGMR